jgi:dynein light intermediate chain 1, cytosolic
MPGSGKTADTSSEAKQIPVIPLGPGEWEDGLGVPLSVICLNANKIERMEREFGWQEEQFDFVLQWMRCVLLKRKSDSINTHEESLLTAAMSRRGFADLYD